CREGQPRLVDTDITAPFDGSLREFAEHHQFGQWGYATRLPDPGQRTDRSSKFRTEANRQALVAAAVLMRARVFVPRAPDQRRARDQVVRSAARAITERPLAHIRHRVAVVALDERLLVQLRGAAVFDDGNRSAAVSGSR